MQVENLTRELSTTGDLHTQLTAKVHDLEKENLVLKNRADEVWLKPQFTRDIFSQFNDLFTLRDTDSGTDSDSEPTPVVGR